MKIQFRLLVFALLPALGLLSALLPRIFWEIRPWSNEKYHLVLTEEINEGNSPVSWLFQQRKSRSFQFFHSLEQLDGRSGQVLYLSSPPRIPQSDDEALLLADKIKDFSGHYSLLAVDGSAFPEGIHPLYQRTLERYLGVENTGWTLRYFRDLGNGSSMSESLKQEIQALGVVDLSQSLLIFKHSLGSTVVLEAGKYFSGLPPKAVSAAREAPVFQWIPIYRLNEDERDYCSTTASLDLALTEEGMQRCRQLGIPTTIPLVVEQKQGQVSTQFVAVDMQEKRLNPLEFRREWKALFKAQFSLFRPGSPEAFFWRIYLPLLEEKIELAEPTEKKEAVEPWIFEARNGHFYQNRGAGEKPFYIQGVNLGPALPGRWFTQFPQDEKLYYRWFTEMKEYHLNSLRVYTLLPPAFYRAFERFNLEHSEDPLFLIQELWPEEHPPENNYLEETYNREFHMEIKRGIDALHGNADIAARKDRAWGRYRSDVSPWLLAILIGRELEPEEVLTTNALNPQFIYKGQWVSAFEGPATEAWLAWACDLAASYEMEQYRRQTAIGIVSWPTLDPLFHPSEWRDPVWGDKAPFHDKAELDINRIDISDSFSPGLFGAYHIYPNYPDFMNNQESYAQWSDSEGSFRYGGYLQEFLEQHSRYPAIVAEYGLSNSQATAHVNPHGYHHGGLTVQEQAGGIRRMTQIIHSQGYAGALVFEWMDEWAKKTWTTEPLMIPYDRQVLWHNALDPEQNYGLMAMESRGRFGFNQVEEQGMQLSLWGNESHLYVQLQGDTRNEAEPQMYMLGLDIIDAERGNHTFPMPDSPIIPRGMEWAAQIDPRGMHSRMLACESINWGLSRFSSGTEEEPWTSVQLLVNRAWVHSDGSLQDALYSEIGLLHHGDFTDIHNNILLTDQSFIIRIPWGLLGVSDPSSGMVLDDPEHFEEIPAIRDSLRISQSKEIALYLVIKKEEEILRIPSSDNGLIFNWQSWDLPQYEQRPKESLRELKDTFASLH